MSNRFTQVGRARALGMYADWSDRIAKGELPDQTPPRPQGIERNVVVTMWDWADEKSVPARRHLDRQAQPDGQRERSDLWRARRERRLLLGDRSEDEHRVADQARPARRRYTELRGPAAGRAVAVLGRRSDLEQPDIGPQLRDGQAGSCLGRGPHPQTADPGLVPGGLGSPVSEAVPDHAGSARADHV